MSNDTCRSASDGVWVVLGRLTPLGAIPAWIDVAWSRGGNSGWGVLAGFAAAICTLVYIAATIGTEVEQ